RLHGYIVNKFRGDVSLFDGALETLRQRTALPCLGVVPFFPAARQLPAEDCVVLEDWPRAKPATEKLHIVVPRLPRIANFDDLDPLAAEPGVALDLIAPGRPLPLADLVLLPGSKATLADLSALRAEGWDIDIIAHRRRGGHVLGICGRCQMLGRRIADPDCIAGPAGGAPGLGVLDVETVLTGEKMLVEADGIELVSGAAVRGYEMHVGRTAGVDAARPMLRLAGRADGAVSADGRVCGCHLHGLFASDGFRRTFLSRLGGA